MLLMMTISLQMLQVERVSNCRTTDRLALFIVKNYNFTLLLCHQYGHLASRATVTICPLSLSHSWSVGWSALRSCPWSTTGILGCLRSEDWVISPAKPGCELDTVVTLNRCSGVSSALLQWGQAYLPCVYEQLLLLLTDRVVVIVTLSQANCWLCLWMDLLIGMPVSARVMPWLLAVLSRYDCNKYM